MDGKTWSKLRTYYSDLIPHLLVHTTIFARFQPDQKTQLISSLQKLDYVVSMVGDGANDCGASVFKKYFGLQSAHKILSTLTLIFPKFLKT